MSVFKEHRCVGLLNYLNKKLTFIFNLPLYVLFGPGTKLERYLSEEKQDSNPLNKTLRANDIVYDVKLYRYRSKIKTIESMGTENR